uniref:Uncharacterized protein n=1 Tax=Anguilla anguilla TaxID=7936 RepID=A0A0E9PJ07_ANGAN
MAGLQERSAYKHVRTVKPLLPLQRRSLQEIKQ